jgi:alkylated DNA repair dioxygenase AlkB
MSGTVRDASFGDALVHKVFGSDDEDSDDGTSTGDSGNDESTISDEPPADFIAPTRQRHVGCLSRQIPGLQLSRGALTPEAQKWLLRCIQVEQLVELPTLIPETTTEANLPHEAPSALFAPDVKEQSDQNSNRRNQSMRFGNFPLWAMWLAHHAKTLAVTDELLPPEITSRGEMDGQQKKRKKSPPPKSQTLFDQFIVNVYTPGDGIAPHVDLHAFDDGLCVVSLLTTTVMDFYAPEEGGGEKNIKIISSSAKQKATSSVFVHTPETSSGLKQIGIRLDPGDVLFLSGDARWRWRHGIAARTFDCDGSKDSGEKQKTSRGFRVSVTLRALREEGRTLTVAAE